MIMRNLLMLSFVWNFVDEAMNITMKTIEKFNSSSGTNTSVAFKEFFIYFFIYFLIYFAIISTKL